jgi:hypothetical protein
VNAPWWTAFGPADTSLRCGEGEHRLRWADGTLQPVDHPDAEGELVLAALGGDTHPCLDLVTTWGKHCDDLTVLQVGPRSASDTVTIPAEVLAEAASVSGPGGQAYHGLGNPLAQLAGSGGGFIRRGQFASTVSTYRPGRAGRRGPIPPQVVRRAAMRRARMLGGTDRDAQARAELIKLLALGVPFQFRLSAAVAHAWSADGGQAGRAERARPALTAALTGRLAPAAAQWMGINPDEVDVSIHDGASWGKLAVSKTAGHGRLEVRLPVGWLASVWAPGFAVVDGHLVVSVLDADWPGARVLAVRSPGKEPVHLSIRSDKGHWSVTSQ